MMNKKKLVAVITLGFFAVYLSFMFIIYKGASEKVRMDFANVMSERLNYSDFEAYTPEQFVGFKSDDESKKYPSLFTIYDKDKNIVAQTGSIIGLRYIDKYVFLDKYLTSNDKKQISGYKKKIKNTIYVKDFKYTVEKDEIVPVELTLCAQYGENPLTLKLSDREPTQKSDVILGDEGTPFEIYVDFRDVYEPWYNRKTYSELKKYAQKDIYENIDFIAIYENTDFNDNYIVNYGDLVGSGEIERLGTLMLDGEKYVYLRQAKTDLFWETLNSDLFTYQIKSQTAVMCLLYFVSLFFAIKLFNKKNRLDKSRNAFICAAAHELKTPISAIENYSECITENIAPEKNTDYIRTIHGESLRMDRLVSSLLQYNRLASATQIEKGRCSLSDIVKREVQEYMPLIESKGVTLKEIIIPDASVFANEELIALVIDNFLSNALKHTESGGLIKLNLEKVKNTYRFSVFNEGSQIQNEYADDLWDVFYRADTARNSSDKSTGMGLAICKQILEHHLCSYGFNNKADGVEFYFIIHN